MIKITFIIPYKEIEEKVYRCLEELKEEEVVFETTHIVGTREALLKKCDADIVVARGITYLALKENLKNISVIEIAITGYDIMAAILECKKRYDSKKVAIIASESIIYDVGSLQEIMNMEIEVFKIKDEEEVIDALNTAREHGDDTIIGGLTAYNSAVELGWNCVQIRTGEEAIKRSIKEALNAANAARLERAKAELLNTILESAKEAIIAVDENGIITAFNKAAYKTLNIPQNRKIKGQPIKGMISESDLLEALEKGEEEIGAIKTMNGVMVVSDRVPIKVESKNLGFICTFQNINKIQEIESKIRKELNNKGLIAKYTFGNIVGNSNVLKKTIETAYKYSRVDSNILLIGETGTGKELFAQSIHNASNRSLQPFVAINCAAVPENLLESELFGYVEGAFSGATKGGKAGLFELAHRGTIFLDEISEIPVNLQAKLLRVLQEREIRRIGDDKVIPVDVRVFSASNLDLREKVKEGTFRQDLLYRLDVLNLRIPPLREREEDIKSIAQYYIEIHCKGLKKMVPDLMTGAVEALTAYEWPGNIRELRNICERLVVLTDGKYITKEEIIELLSLGDRRLSSEKDESDERIKQTEESSDIDMETMLKLMQLVKVNKEDMAKLLGISRTTLWRRLKDK